MLPLRLNQSGQLEQVLGRHIREVAADLRLIDLSDIVAHLKTGQIASAGALVQSSIELSFRPDTLIFAHSGDVDLQWGMNPKVNFDMEFHHQSVHVYFRLSLETRLAGVEISYIEFDGAVQCEEANTRALALALENARLGRDAEAVSETCM